MSQRLHSSKSKYDDRLVGGTGNLTQSVGVSCAEGAMPGHAVCALTLGWAVPLLGIYPKDTVAQMPTELFTVTLVSKGLDTAQRAGLRGLLDRSTVGPRARCCWAPSGATNSAVSYSFDNVTVTGCFTYAKLTSENNESVEIK